MEEACLLCGSSQSHKFDNISPGSFGKHDLLQTIIKLFSLPLEVEGSFSSEFDLCSDCVESLAEFEYLSAQLATVKSSLENRIKENPFYTSPPSSKDQCFDSFLRKLARMIFERIESNNDDLLNNQIRAVNKVEVQLQEPEEFQDTFEPFNDDIQEEGEGGVENEPIPTGVIWMGNPEDVESDKSEDTCSKLKNAIILLKPLPLRSSKTVFNIQKRWIQDFIMRDEKRVAKIAKKRNQKPKRGYMRGPRSYRKLTKLIPKEIEDMKDLPGPLSCTACTRSYGGARPYWSLRQHFILKHLNTQGGGTHKCLKCDKNFLTKYTLGAHIKYTHTESKDPNLHVCHVCKKNYCSESSLTRHLRYHRIGEPLLICSTCGKGFVSNHNLKIHQNKHSKAREYLCEICAKPLKSKHSLELHVKVMHESTLRCETCGEKSRHFLSQTELEDHVKEFHDKQIVNYTCDLCGKGFYSMVYLKKHQRYHAGGEIKFFCKICGKGFHRPDRLRNHETVHLSEADQFKCNFCEKKFKTKQKRKFHEALHFDHKPFQCGAINCRKAFKLQRYLRFHWKNSHPGETFKFTKIPYPNDSSDPRVQPV